MANWLRANRVVKPRKLNTPRLIGLGDNQGAV
jgi:hypothetical protein